MSKNKLKGYNVNKYICDKQFVQTTLVLANFSNKNNVAKEKTHFSSQ